MIWIIIGSLVGILLLWVILGIRIVRPTHRGVIERLGRFLKVVEPGFHWILPLIDRMRYRNITERINDVLPQDIITKDNLNARVDLQVYTQVKDTIEDIKKSYYGVEDYRTQIIALAQTTARNVIGDMKFSEVNSQRNELNKKLREIIEQEIANWGVAVVRVELKEITPPETVQATMNRVIQAQNEKDAAVDIATAKETEADGLRRAAIKEADGIKQAQVLRAEGEAEARLKIAEAEAKAIAMVNEAAEKTLKGGALTLRTLESLERSLAANVKVVLPSDKQLINVIGEMAGIRAMGQS